MDSRLVVVAMVAVACLLLGVKAQNTTDAMNASSAPTAGPTAAPGAPAGPTTAPGVPATAGPTTAPGAPAGPTTAPGVPATAGPTAAPGVPATAGPTAAPGVPATAGPTAAPGVPATAGPTAAPGVPATAGPTAAPGVPATAGPTTAPGVPATAGPTAAPGVPATAGPTAAPGVPATAGPTTAPGVPATAGPTTAPGVPATAGPTTIQATLFISNNTVETFTSNITRDYCRKTQFCASEPSTCNPSSESCFFVSAAQSSGQEFSFQLNGPSTGYIAMGLAASAAQSNVTTYVCANSNGTFKFFTTFLNNDKLVMTSLPVNQVKGVVRGKLLQCAFTASLPRASVSSKSPDTSFVVSMSNGTFTNDTLGTPTARLRSTEAVDLSNVNSTITNNLTATAAPVAATTASHGITLQHSLSQALLILLGVLGLAML